MKRLMIFMTGQYRCFWETWWNVLDNIIRPNHTNGFTIMLCIGLDTQRKYHQHHWMEGERESFAEVLSLIWRIIGFKDEDLHLHWMDNQNIYFNRAFTSLQRYVQKGRLEQHWFEYLIYRSGSCLEYAQFTILYDWCLEHGLTADFLLRIRTDVLFRHPLHVHEPSSSTRDWNHVLTGFFPSMASFFQKYRQPEGREFSIMNPESGRWILTLRKNLIYLLPFDQAAIIADMIHHYGDWDSIDENAFWFNAESQFRGCLRHHSFQVYEFSQSCDECFHDFKHETEKLPLYAIQRMIPG